MTIEIKTENTIYNIVVEPSCYAVYRLTTTNKGKATEIAIGYFVSISSAVKKIVQTNLSDIKETVSLKEYAERVEEAFKKLMAQVEI